VIELLSLYVDKSLNGSGSAALRYRRGVDAPAASPGAADRAGGGPYVPGAGAAAPRADAPHRSTAADRPRPFAVRLDNFEGPFDLLLTLISRHQLDVTEVALSQVTDEFIAHIRALGKSWDLGQATEFLVVAATLLDLKAARLLPAAQVEDEEDLALLEARDLLFARLLQYRAYKEVAAYLSVLERAQGRRYPRAVPLEPRYADLMPEVLLAVSLDRFARIAASALAPKPPPVVSTEHVHMPRVSIREHASIVRERLARVGRATFRSLTQDCQHTLELVARFLALLELYREGSVAFDQVAPLSELHVRWTGSGDGAEPADGLDVDEEYG
jgi:segregation and condensation protein A